MNKIVYKLFFFILTINLLTSSITASTLIPLGIKPYDFVYEKLEKFEAINQNNYLYSIAPYVTEKKIFDLAPLTFLQSNSIEKLNLFVIANESFSSQTISSPKYFETIRFGVSGKFGKNISFFSNLSLDERKSKDISYTGKKWRGLAGGVEQSFLQARLNNFNIFVGRFKSFWGIKKSLLLSESNALDGLQYSYKYKKLSLTYRIAKLDQLETDLTTSTFDNRYFAGHRLDLRLHKKLRIGLFESIIFGGTGRTVEFNYLNPVMSYHAEQLNNNVNDNSYLGFDFTYYPIEKSKLYGQLLIDDYQVEDESQGDQEPNQYGLIIGGYMADFVKNYDIRLEYIKIKNRTYNQFYERNRYTFENRSLGYFDKNDFDQTNLSLTKWISPNSSFALHLSYQRKGEGNILDEWTEPWLEIDTAYNETFPFGVVEKTTKIAGQYKKFFLTNFYIDAVVGIESIKNRNNIVHSSKQNRFITITLYSFFSKGM